MSAFHKQSELSQDCLYHLYIESIGDIQHSLRVPYPYTQTFRQIIQRALVDILNLRTTRIIDQPQIQTFHNIANNFPQQYLNTNDTGFYPNLYIKIGQKMIDQRTENIELMVDNLLHTNHNSISLNASFISHQPKFNEALFIIVLQKPRNKNDSKRKLSESSVVKVEPPAKRIKISNDNNKNIENDKYKRENVVLKQANKTLKKRMDIMQKRLDIFECKSERINAMNLNELNECKIVIESKMKLIIDAEKQLIDDKYKCVACKDNEKNISFDGCNHISICDKCEVWMESKCCPICQIPYKNIKKINF